ncbi:MAG TPA: cysteine dioxygenase family protein [Vicinamibacteria bacterium]|nr:cysteine dioxygenase family protein [Vicinamibacteria bacterium]
MKTIEQFVEGLCAIPEPAFTPEAVSAFIAASPVDPASLQRFLRYEATHYTRNLIHKCDLFEVMAICWEVGQGSRIHNHQGQNCWMAVPIGRLAVQNYEVVRMDDAGFCELREANRLEMDPAHPSYVEPELPVHAVLNLPEYGQRATSLHVYSHPYDRCLVYDLQARSYMEVPLFYDSVYGEPTPLTSR